MQELYKCLFYVLGMVLVVHSLRVTPGNIQQHEGDDEVHFFCKEDSGTFATGITWTDPQGNSYTPGSPSSGGNPRITAEGSRLSIVNLVRADSGSYRCSRISAPSISASGNLLVTAPPRILNPIPVQEIHHGQTSLIRCEVDRGNPLANIYWLNGSDIITEDFNPRFTVLDNALQIEDVQFTDEGTYRCYVHNDYGTDDLYIQAAFRAAPQFINPLSSDQMNIVRPLGYFINLDCSAVGAPSPNYTWSVPPNSHSAQEPVHRDAILRVLFSNVADVGQYTCIVSNGVDTITRQFTLNNAVEPRPKVARHNFTIPLEEPSNFTCTVNALPLPSFNWALFKDGYDEPLSEESWTVVEKNGSANSMLTRKFKMSDFAEDCTLVLVCNAENDYGSSRQYFILSPNQTSGCASLVLQPPTLPPTLSANNQNSVGDTGEGDGSQGEEKGDSVSTTVVAAIIGVVLLIIVVLVVLLVAYFIKHFCKKHRSSKQQVCTSTTANGPPAFTQTTPIPIPGHTPNHAHQETVSITIPEATPTHTICRCGTGTSLSSIRTSTTCASVSSVSSYPHPQIVNTCVAHGHTHLVPTSTHTAVAAPSPLTAARAAANGSGDDTYHRLDHFRSHRSASTFNSTVPPRLSSSSSTHSNVPLLHQSSGSTDDDSASSVFSESPDSRHLLMRQRSDSGTEHLLTTGHTPVPNVNAGSVDPELYSNPAYERSDRRWRIAPSSCDENTPHEYETVA